MNNICENRFDKIPVCKGHCYLKKQLKTTEKQENKYPEKKHKELQLFFTIIELSTSNQNEIQENISKGFSTFNFFSSKKIVSLFKPPQFK